MSFWEDVKEFFWELRHMLIMFFGWSLCFFSFAVESYTAPDYTWPMIILVSGIFLGFYGFYVQSEYQYMTIEEIHHNPSMFDRFCEWLGESFFATGKFWLFLIAWGAFFVGAYDINSFLGVFLIFFSYVLFYGTALWLGIGSE